MRMPVAECTAWRAMLPAVHCTTRSGRASAIGTGGPVGGRLVGGTRRHDAEEERGDDRQREREDAHVTGLMGRQPAAAD